MTEVEPTIKLNGSAFNGRGLNNTRPIPKLANRTQTNVVRLSLWCANNFITLDTGYKLIKLKYLIAFRRHGYWQVCANPDCLAELLDYLGLEQLYFDADN